MEKFNARSIRGGLPPLSNIRARWILSLLLSLFPTILFSDPSCCALISEEEATESLLSLPYAQYVKNESSPNKAGTTIYNKDKAFQGYSIFASHNDPHGFVHLIDMDGTLIHRWARNPNDPFMRWYQVTPFPDGSVFLTSKLTQTDWLRVDVNSRPFFIYNLPGQAAHHASYFLKDGSFISLVESKIPLPFQDAVLKGRDNSLVQISPQGKPLIILPLSELLSKDSSYQEKLKKAYAYQKNHPKKRAHRKAKIPSFDFFHANNIVNLEWDIPGIAKKGAWLVTIRNLSKIILVDPKTKQILWDWGENIISMPHDATFLKEDQILLFDNGVNKKSSRVIIVNMKSREIIWQYGQKPGQEFFTAQRGSAQQLPNGNTLIVESDKGRAFEVTTSGEIVWEWYADFYTEGKHKGKRRIIYRIERLPYDFFKGVTFNHGKI